MAKILKHSVPPGYQRGQAPKRPKLDPYTGIIDQILEDDKSESKKQRHTCKRIFEWLRDEHGYSGGITIVTDYVRARKRLGKEVFVPLAHDPGHAQVDFGEAWAIIAGVRRKVHYFALDLPHSDACFVKAYPAETTEAFCDGHVAAFGFFGGIPLSILYDNTTLAVAKIKKDGKRVRTETFTKLQSHYLFQDKFARPAKGNEKGKVEGLIGYVRRNYLVPIPRFDSFDALNAWLEEQCLKRQGDQLRGRGETIEARLMRDLDTLMALPATPYDACEQVSTSANSISMVRYRNNDYSVPVAYVGAGTDRTGAAHDRTADQGGPVRGGEKPGQLRLQSHGLPQQTFSDGTGALPIYRGQGERHRPWSLLEPSLILLPDFAINSEKLRNCKAEHQRLIDATREVIPTAQNSDSQGIPFLGWM